MKTEGKELSPEAQQALLATLQARFEKNMPRHPQTNWNDVEACLMQHRDKLWSLMEMERTGGEPDLIPSIANEKKFCFVDCAAESPSGRRSLCYDRQAWEARKEHKPTDNAVDMAAAMGIELLDETTYRHLQEFGSFDLKTSSWLLTPEPIRKLGGAIFGDKRYNQVFIYHNGVQSYYAARGFRGLLQVDY